MKMTALIFVAALAAAPLAAQTGAVVAGKPIFTSDGKRIGVIYRVTSDGAAQLILNSKLVTIPAASISAPDGKYQTSLTKKELASAS
jgi:hypothetical protein